MSDKVMEPGKVTTATAAEPGRWEGGSHPAVRRATGTMRLLPYNPAIVDEVERHVEGSQFKSAAEAYRQNVEAVNRLKAEMAEVSKLRAELEAEHESAEPGSEERAMLSVRLDDLHAKYDELDEDIGRLRDSQRRYEGRMIPTFVVMAASKGIEQYLHVAERLIAGLVNAYRAIAIMNRALAEAGVDIEYEVERPEWLNPEILE